MIKIADAITSLVPNCAFEIKPDGSVNWLVPTVAPVTEEQIQAELVRLQAAYGAAEYQRKRSAEYPPITYYLDGVVKGDQAQIDKYIADCQAVKAKYPKGS